MCRSRSTVTIVWKLGSVSLHIWLSFFVYCKEKLHSSYVMLSKRKFITRNKEVYLKEREREFQTLEIQTNICSMIYLPKPSGIKDMYRFV